MLLLVLVWSSSNTFPLAIIKSGNGDVGQDVGRVQRGLSGTSGMVTQLTMDSLGIAIIRMGSNDVLAFVSANAGFKDSMNILLLFRKDLARGHVGVRIEVDVKDIFDTLGSSLGQD